MMFLPDDPVVLQGRPSPYDLGGIPWGRIVLIVVGQTMHCAAKVMGATEEPGLLWLDVNTLGSHLPQMYRLDEIVGLEANELADHALCPGCYGFGELPESGLCVTCKGTGRLWLTASTGRPGLECELCDKAFPPSNRRY